MENCRIGWEKKKKQKQKVSIWERERAKKNISYDRMCDLGHLLYKVARYAFFSPPKKFIYSSTFWVRCDRICWLPETEVNQVGFATLGARCPTHFGSGPTSFQSPLFPFSHISNQKVRGFFFFSLNNQKARLIFDRDVLSS